MCPRSRRPSSRNASTEVTFPCSPFEAGIADLPDHDQHRIPTGEFPHRFAELSPGDEIVVYCRSGSRSAWAVAVLMQQGYERVYNLQGGVLGWKNEVDPSLRAY